MSASFLSTFMHFALEKTGAERGIATDIHGTIIDGLNIDQTVVLSDDTLDVIRRALAQGEPVITNNVIKDASSAPNTNTNFSNLRIIVVIPVAGVGAVYLDQPIRRGVIPKDVVDRLMALGAQVVNSGQTDLSDSQLSERYETIRSA